MRTYGRESPSAGAPRPPAIRRTINPAERANQEEIRIGRMLGDGLDEKMPESLRAVGIASSAVLARKDAGHVATDEHAVWRMGADVDRLDPSAPARPRVSPSRVCAKTRTRLDQRKQKGKASDHQRTTRITPGLGNSLAVNVPVADGALPKNSPPIRSRMPASSPRFHGTKSKRTTPSRTILKP